MPEFIMYGGKGGVGKTTCASSTAYGLAKNGYKTVVISTDPAHSIQDVFEQDIGPSPVKVNDDHELYAVEVDPESRFNNNYADSFDAITNEAEKFGLDLTDGVDVDIQGVVGSDELAVVDLFSDYVGNDDWDYVVFDTAPTGHTLRMLRLPNVLDSTLGKAFQVKSQLDNVTGKVTGFFGDDDEDEPGLEDVDVEETRSKIERVADVLQNPEKTQFRAIMEAERLSMLETNRLLDELHENDINVDRVVVNKVLTDINKSCQLCSSRRETQQGVLTEAADEFDVPMYTVPLVADPDEEGTVETVAKNLGNLDAATDGDTRQYQPE